MRNIQVFLRSILQVRTVVFKCLRIAQHCYFSTVQYSTVWA